MKRRGNRVIQKYPVPAESPILTVWCRLKFLLSQAVSLEENNVLLNAEAVKYGWGHSLKSRSYTFGSSTERMISC
ncbi:hypothetical protein CFP56_014311 [Quercus suber]|uniref:Uncharacterized protein n=1 Tax=Quercus suber TaxID=58331 RepID=A0AAW0KTU5_QUESU